MFALALPAAVGVAGLGVEASDWYLTQRAMQNAADAAVLAAAANGGSSYASEARAVASGYGFTNGANNVVVAASNAAACPSGGNTCYRVDISGSVQSHLARAVGFTGSVPLSATASASKGTTYCMVALASSGTSPAIQTNGAPKANMAGCSLMSNSGATCNGHNLGADIGNAHGVNNGCGVIQNSNVAPIGDPYARLASNIPSNTCSSYPQEPAKKSGTPLPASNLWSGARTLSGNTIICGDLQLTGNVTITANPGVLVIENGQLDTNGFTLQTSPNSGLAIVFTGSSSGGYTHAPTGGGTIDIAAPTSGAWAGVAIYQDPGLTSGVDISAAGNSPTWNISGLVYLPHAGVTLSGAVNKSSNGASCFVIVSDNITVNGTGDILTNGGCAAAGLNMPKTRGPLVN
jgi:Flp pilus assembly protein TadG